MVISKMVFNESSAFKEVFAGGYALHQAVWDLFADDPGRKRDFLYRLDYLGRMPLVHTVSSREPVNTKGLWRIESKVYEPKLETAMNLGFNVRVNPTVKRDNKRHDVIMDAKYKTRISDSLEDIFVQGLIADECGKWLERRAKENGFEVLRFRADGYQQIKFNKAKGGEPVRYSTIDITGVLKVVDQKLFRDVLLNGLGPEKGFGCGLMLVRRI